MLNLRFRRTNISLSLSPKNGKLPSNIGPTEASSLVGPSLLPVIGKKKSGSGIGAVNRKSLNIITIKAQNRILSGHDLICTRTYQSFSQEISGFLQEKPYFYYNHAQVSESRMALPNQIQGEASAVHFLMICVDNS